DVSICCKRSCACARCSTAVSIEPPYLRLSRDSSASRSSIVARRVGENSSLSAKSRSENDRSSSTARADSSPSRYSRKLESCSLSALAVNIDEERTQIAQQRLRGQLIVDEDLVAAGAGDFATDD